MSELTEQLDKLIQQAALDGTLTEEGVAHFHSLVQQCSEQAEELRTLNKGNIKLIDERDKLKIDLGLAKALNKVAAEAEVAMIEREKNITTLELTANFQEQRVNDHKKMVELIFRNSVIRKEVMTPTHPSAPDQYGTRQEGYPNKDTVEEEEG